MLSSLAEVSGMSSVCGYIGPALEKVDTLEEGWEDLHPGGDCWSDELTNSGTILSPDSSKKPKETWKQEQSKQKDETSLNRSLMPDNVKIQH